MRAFASWLAGTDLSSAIQSELWVVPTVQSVHILAIGVLFACVVMVSTKMLGLTGRDRTLAEVTRYFMTWFWLGLAVLAVSGLLLIVGEPARELLSLSFWLKMLLIAIGVTSMIALERHASRNERRWEDALTKPSTKAFATVVLGLWCAIVILGRLIAWDSQIWGSWSPQL